MKRDHRKNTAECIQNLQEGAHEKQLHGEKEIRRGHFFKEDRSTFCTT